MTASVWACRITCDHCGTETDATRPPGASLETTPAGWLNLGYYHLRDIAGNPVVTHLCPDCCGLPFATIFGHTQAQP